MGVDITAYSQIEKTKYLIDEDYNYIDPENNEIIDGDYVNFYINPDFPGRAHEIKNENVYTYKESHHVISLGYNGYGLLREELAKLAGYKLKEFYNKKTHCAECWKGKEGPFSELINFSDCEGVIGESVSKKLFDDFEKFQEKADMHQNPFFREFYDNMKMAFKIASNKGAVEFS